MLPMQRYLAARKRDALAPSFDDQATLFIDGNGAGFIRFGPDGSDGHTLPRQRAMAAIVDEQSFKILVQTLFQLV